MRTSFHHSTAILVLPLVFAGASQAAEQTLSPGANVVAAIMSAATGDIINLNPGNYGTADLSGVVKSGMVTVRSATGTRTASIYLKTGVSDSQTISARMRFLTFRNLTIQGLDVEGMADISFVDNAFTGACSVRTPRSLPNANILFDRNTFIDIRAGLWEGRLTVRGYDNTQPVGVKVTNNYFGNTANSTADTDGFQVIGGAYGVQFGPGNEIANIRQVPGGAHTDPLQLYGSAKTIITGNYIHDCSSGMQIYPDADNGEITNNVMTRLDAGQQALSVGGWTAGLIAHNTIVNHSVSVTGGSGSVIVRDNIATGGFNLQQGLAVGSYNQTSATFVGGSAPTTWAGFKLVAGSLGTNAASDGTDIGAQTFGPATQGNQAPVASSTNVTVTSGMAKAITLSGSDADGNPLTYAITANPTHGTLTGSGANRTYTPTAGYAGPDSFTFTVNDGTATSAVATVSITVAPAASTGTGTGLAATYFANRDFTGATVQRADATVDFDWGVNAPVAGIGADNFSVRWSGQVQAQYSQTYTFFATGDDGIRLRVNGQLLIDQWKDQAPTEYSGTIALTAGQKYDLVLEYYENAGGAVARLWWSSPSTAKQVIPTAQLYPAVVTSVNQMPVVSAATATPAPVATTTASLAATATDDGGEAALGYTWSATGPATVSFSPNGTNAAKASTATFSKAGSYVLTVTARDAGNLTGTRTVAVTVAATATTVSISPTSASVQPNRSVDFNALALDQFGLAMATQPAVAWEVSNGGTIDANGLFTAGTGGANPVGGVAANTYTVKATVASQSATALVTISTASTATAAGGGGCGGGAAGLLLGIGALLGLRQRRRIG